MTRTRKIVHLQTLRAVAASAVVVAHAIEYPVRRHLLPDDYYQLAWCFGWIGVATFFVISGLIMIRSSYDDFGSRAKAGRFALRRLIRIVPLYWLATIPFAAAAVARHETVTAGMVVKSLLFIPYSSVERGLIRPIVGQAWTLNFEMLFYAVFALCLTMRRGVGIAALVAVFPVVVLVRAAVSPLVPYADPVTPLAFWSDPITLLFVVGVLVGLVEMRARRWHRIALPTTISVALFAVTIATFLAAGARFPMQIGWQALFGAVAAVSVLLCTSGKEVRLSRVGRVAEAAGDGSYSTYLIHPLVLMAIAALWDRLPPALQQPPAFVAIAVLLCNLVGYASFRLVELPLTFWLRRRIDRRRALYSAQIPA